MCWGAWASFCLPPDVIPLVRGANIKQLNQRDAFSYAVSLRKAFGFLEAE